MGFTYEFPPDHDERMRVLEQTTASLGWRMDDTMTMLESRARLVLEMAQKMLNGQNPIVVDVAREMAQVCSLLNVERQNAANKAAATQLLHELDRAKGRLMRRWVHPSTAEIQQQIALLEPLYNAVNDKLNRTWPECRSESDEKDCKALGHALRHRKKQLAERSPLQAQAV